MAIVEALQSEGPRRRMRVRSPASLQPIGEFECGTAEDVRAAVQRARVAQGKWAALSFDQRAGYLRRLVDQFVERQDEVIETVIAETGKARTEAIAMEVYSPCDAISYYAKHGGTILAPSRRRLHGVMRLTKTLRIVYQPLGVVGLITPWNGPVVLAAVPLAQALMAGNAVVHKPSEVTPLSALVLKSLTEGAGFPEDLYQVVQGDGQTGAALIESGVDKVAFTGSVATGRAVAVACARRLLPYTLELGGKDAMIVCADADLERAAAGAVIGSCMNTGHYCCGTERVYVVESIYDRFVEKVVEKVQALRQGDRGEFDVGAVFWDAQLAIIESHVEDARARGATVRAGGRRNPDLAGLYFEPTVITDVEQDMDVMKKETFGPIVAIKKVRDEEEAIRLANDSEYGLNGTVWTTDSEKGIAIAARLHTGGVCVNDMTISYGIPEAPFGGRKASGVGQVNGPEGLRGYCHAQPILVDRRGRGKIQGGYPYSRAQEDGMQKFIRILWGTRVGRWISSL